MNVCNEIYRFSWGTVGFRYIYKWRKGEAFHGVDLMAGGGDERACFRPGSAARRDPLLFCCFFTSVEMLRKFAHHQEKKKRSENARKEKKKKKAGRQLRVTPGKELQRMRRGLATPAGVGFSFFSVLFLLLLAQEGCFSVMCARPAAQTRPVRHLGKTRTKEGLPSVTSISFISLVGHVKILDYVHGNSQFYSPTHFLTFLNQFSSQRCNSFLSGGGGGGGGVSAVLRYFL